MSNTSYFHGNEVIGSDFKTSATAKRPTAAGQGLFARLLAGIVRAREAQARNEANRYLARQPDRLLLDIGLDATEIADLRRRYEA